MTGTPSCRIPKLLLCCLLVGLAGPAAAQPTQTPAAAQPDEAVRSPEQERQDAIFRSIDWHKGPDKVAVGEQAELALPEGYVFTGAAGAQKMLELMQNPTDGKELGLLMPADMRWFLLFEFQPIGYVEDAEEEELDADDILDSIKEGAEASNEERRGRGWSTIQVTGWQTAPFFDKGTKNLQWGVKGESEGQPILNYNTRILGRHGVMSANLLVAPDKLEATLPAVKQLLASFSYSEGHRYAEFKPGDKIAEYGLAALVVGGAVGVAAKVGLFAKFAGMLGKLWKLVLLALFALGAGIKSLLGRRKSSEGGGSFDEWEEPAGSADDSPAASAADSPAGSDSADDRRL